MKFKNLYEAQSVYKYNIELEQPYKGKKFTVINNKSKLKPKTKYKADIFGDGNEIVFTIYREIKPNDLDFNDYAEIATSLESLGHKETDRLCNKIDKNLRIGKLVKLTSEDLELFMYNIVYDEDKFNDFRSDDDKKLVKKIMDRYSQFKGWVTIRPSRY